MRTIAALNRQDVAGGSFQTTLEHAAHAIALDRILQTIVGHLDVDRQVALALEIMHGIFERGHCVFGIETQPAREGLGEALGIVGTEFARDVGLASSVRSCHNGTPSLRQ